MVQLSCLLQGLTRLCSSHSEDQSLNEDWIEKQDTSKLIRVMARMYFLVVVGLKALASCCLLVKVTLSSYKLPALSYLVSLPTWSLASSSLRRRDRIQKDKSNPVHIITHIPQPLVYSVCLEASYRCGPKLRREVVQRLEHQEARILSPTLVIYIHISVQISIQVQIYLCM